MNPNRANEDRARGASRGLAGRRRALRALALAPGAAATAIGARTARAQEAASSLGLISPNVCLVATEVTEGPYYVDPGLVRADITEGLPGVPLELALQVVDDACEPVAGARVDLWQCDARGNYSGIANQGSDATLDTADETFLRGTQLTGDGGVATFRTIWPGWYRGRTAHLHYKVFLDEQTVLTSQVFLPDALSEYLYRNVTPYTDRAGERGTFNRNDWIAREAGAGAFAAVRELDDRYVAALVVGVDPLVESVGGDRPALRAGGQPPPPSPGPDDGASPRDGPAGSVSVVPEAR